MVNFGAFQRLYVRMKDTSDVATKKEIKERILSSVGGSSLNVYDSKDNDDTMNTVVLVLDVFFSVVIGLNMFLCFFSLTASMTTNILEQSKELAVMRAMGFSKRKVLGLYIGEAFVLVFSASILGIFIGTFVGWTMTLQRVVFTQIPLSFFFPLTQFIVIFLISIICAILSVLGPARSLLRHEIAQIFRI